MTALNREDVKAIVFDLDGTLYEDERLGEQVSLSASRYIAELKGISIPQAETMIEEARQSLSGLGRTLSRAILSLGGNLREMHERMARDVRPEGVLKVDEGVTRLLKRLGQTYDLHIYTNNNRDLSGRIMSEIGVTPYFRKVFTIEDFWRAKPDRDALQGILEAIGRRPAETLFVGDRYAVDLELPKELGCQVYEARTIRQLLGLAELVE